MPGAARPDDPGRGPFRSALLEDLLSGGPPGVWTLSFVLTYALVARQRDSFAGLSGLGAVLGFAAAAPSPAPRLCHRSGRLFWRMPPLPPLLLGELAMTVLFYVPDRLGAGLASSPPGRPLRERISDAAVR